MASYEHSILWRGEDPTKKKFAPRYDGSKKIARYFPGQAPKWEQEEEESDAEVFQGLSSSSRAGRASSGAGASSSSSRPGPLARPGQRPPPTGEGFSRHGPSGRADGGRKKAEEKKPAAVVEDVAVSRLKRLKAAEEAGVSSRTRARVLEEGDAKEDLEAEIARIRARLPKPSTDKEQDDVAKEELKDEEDEDEDDNVVKTEVKVEVKQDVEDDDPEVRREKARELALLRRKQEEIALLKEEEEADEPPEEDEDEEESEEESSEEDNDPRRGAMMKPVFVPRHQRVTVKEREALEKEEEEAYERKKKREQDRKVESKALLVDEIRRDEEAERAGVNENEASDGERIDDDDELNEAEEYDKWKIRELQRIKRNKEERMSKQKELEWVERRRRMTDEEREEDDRRLDAGANSKQEANQFNFMQKYYHRGGFFQDKAVNGEEPLYLRDFHEPLESEKYDKNLLPRAMQLRRGEFGKKGQVKHTHLTQEDTTDRTAAWAQHTKVVQRYQEKMAGAKGIMNFDRPSSKKSSGSHGP